MVVQPLRCVHWAGPMFGPICDLRNTFKKHSNKCKSQCLNVTDKTCWKMSYVLSTLSSQWIRDRCKCAVRLAHAKLARKATAVLGKAAPHAGKSHVGSPLSTAWFANKTWMQHPINSSLHATHSGSDFFLQFSTLHVPAALPLNIKWEAMFWCIIRISEDRDKRSSKC